MNLTAKITTLALMSSLVINTNNAFAQPSSKASTIEINKVHEGRAYELFLGSFLLISSTGHAIGLENNAWTIGSRWVLLVGGVASIIDATSHFPHEVDAEMLGQYMIMKSVGHVHLENPDLLDQNLARFVDKYINYPNASISDKVALFIKLTETANKIAQSVVKRGLEQVSSDQVLNSSYQYGINSRLLKANSDVLTTMVAYEAVLLKRK